jgi:hypothetical protein
MPDHLVGNIYSDLFLFQMVKNKKYISEGMSGTKFSKEPKKVNLKSKSKKRARYFIR